MEITLYEVIQIGLTVAFAAGFAWTLTVIYRHYQIEERPPIRFRRMLRHLGIEKGSLAEWRVNLYRPSAIRLCLYCPSEAECDTWFAQKGNVAVLPAFCPNATIPELVAGIPQMRAD